MARISYREAINQALFEEMKRDESVVILGDPIPIPRGATDDQLEHHRQHLENTLIQLTEQADRLAQVGPSEAAQS